MKWWAVLNIKKNEPTDYLRASSYSATIFSPFEMAGNVKLTANKALVKYPLVQILGPSRLIESIARMEKLSTACLNDLNFSKTHFVWGARKRFDFAIEIPKKQV